MQSTKCVHEAYEYQRSRSFSDLGPGLSDSIIFNFFSSITTRLIEAKFHVEPPLDGGMKACSNGPGHMTKVAAMPIYGKNLLLWHRKADDHETWHAASSTHVLTSLFKGCPRVDLDLFYGKVKFGTLWAFISEKIKTMDFSGTIVVCDIKVGRCSQLNEYMKLWVPKVRVIHWPCSKSLRFNIFKLLFLNNHWF